MKSKNSGNKALVVMSATSTPAIDHCIYVYSSVVTLQSHFVLEHQVQVIANTQPLLAMPLSAHHLEDHQLF